MNKLAPGWLAREQLMQQQQLTQQRLTMIMSLPVLSLSVTGSDPLRPLRDRTYAATATAATAVVVAIVTYVCRMASSGFCTLSDSLFQLLQILFHKGAGIQGCDYSSRTAISDDLRAPRRPD